MGQLFRIPGGCQFVLAVSCMCLPTGVLADMSAADCRGLKNLVQGATIGAGYEGVRGEEIAGRNPRFKLKGPAGPFKSCEVKKILQPRYSLTCPIEINTGLKEGARMTAQVRDDVHITLIQLAGRISACLRSEPAIEEDESDPLVATDATDATFTWTVAFGGGKDSKKVKLQIFAIVPNVRSVFRVPENDVSAWVSIEQVQQ